MGDVSQCVGWGGVRECVCGGEEVCMCVCAGSSQLGAQ